MADLRTAYAKAGVDVAAGERVVELIRRQLPGMSLAPGLDMLGGLGGFAAATPLPGGMRNPVIFAATDGVGTKTEIARELDRLGTIGIDLVAMCADDVVCHGARPWLFLDYVAVGKVDPERVAAIVGGIADGCRLAGCALVGGETAEHPDVMPPDVFDLAGFCVGIAERDDVIDGSSARRGDAVIGIASSGLHANGYSLVRMLIRQFALDLDEPYADVLVRVLGSRAVHYGEAAGTLGDVLLSPTRIYAPHLLALRDKMVAQHYRLSGIAHITGGGLPGNLSRAVPQDLAIAINPSSWPQPAIVELMSALGGLSALEARATFNAGIGIAIVIEPAAVNETVAFLAGQDLTAWRIGEVIDAGDAGESRYVEVAA